MKSSKFRASRPDLLMAGGRYIGICGPVSPWDPAAARAAMVQLAVSGSRTRVGVRPHDGTARWDLDDRIPDDIVRTAPAPQTLADVARVSESIRRAPGDRLPLTVHLAGDYILIDTDHRVGDGQLYVNLAGAIDTFVRTGRLNEWPDTRETPNPLLRALWRTFGRRPAAGRELLGARRELQGHFEPVAQADARTEPWAPSFAVELAATATDVAAALDTYRKQHRPDTSAAVLSIELVHRALRRAGIPVSAETTVAVNCRRYLTPGSTVNGNFVVGMATPTALYRPDVGATDTLRAVYESGLPLAALARAARHPSQPTPITSVPTVRRADVMFTDLGRARPIDALSWTGPVSQRIWGGLLDPSGPLGITVMASTIERRRTYSFTFHDNVFDRARVQRCAAELTTDPVGLLTDDSLDEKRA